MRFLIPPNAASYAVEFGEENIRTQLDGGLGRYRKDIANPSDMVNCSWNLTPQEYKYAMAFWRSQTAKGADPFQIELIVENENLGERLVRIMPNTWKLTGQAGLTYFLSAQLEIMPIIDEDQAAEDATTIEDYNELQGYTP